MPTTQWIEVRRLIVPAVSLAAIFGTVVFSLVAPEPSIPELNVLLEEQVVLEGVVVRDPEPRERTTHITVRVERVDGVVLENETRVLLFVEKFSNVQYGDRLAVYGEALKPEPFETDSGRTFDYPKYLLAHGITHTLIFPDIDVVAKGEGNAIVAKLLAVKHAFVRSIERAIPEPESALLSGLILGEKQSLGENITEAMRNAGVVHIIVLSGYNVSLIIQATTFMLLYLLPRAWAYALAAVFVVLFAVMTGLSETTLRATIMALLMMVATVLHRPKAALRGLMIAAAIMALSSPYIVLYDLSFQLSVLATGGLILFADKISVHLQFITAKLKLREIVATTIATQITVLPLLIYSIGAVSLVFLPANTLVLPAVPLAMLLGFITGILGLVSSALALPVSLFAYGALRYIVDISYWFGSLPGSSIEIPRPWMPYVLAALAACYVSVFFYVMRRKTFSLPPSRSDS